MHYKRELFSIVLIICFFAVLQAQHYQLDTTYTTARALKNIQKNYPNTKAIPALNTDKLIQFENICYKTTSDSGYVRNLHLDVFRPANSKKLPALIMIHGGGWRSGNKSMGKPMAQRIALKNYVTIPVEYRLSLEAKYPAAVHDIKAAIRFIKANAEKYNIDTTKIAIEGESAGGQLALLVAMTNNQPKFEGPADSFKTTSIVHAVIDVDGVVNFLAPNSLNIDRKPDSADRFWLGASFTENPLLWKEASSIYWINKNSVPAAFITSAAPRFHAGRDELIDIYNQLGIYSASYNIPDSPHSFWMYEPWMKPTINYITKFLNKVF